MEKHPVEPAAVLNDALDVAPLPIEDTPAATATGSHSELDTTVSTPAEGGTALLRQAQKTKFSGDGIDRGTDVMGMIGTAGSMIATGVAGLITTFSPEVGPLASASAGVAVAGMGGLMYVASRLSTTSVQLADGYSLQCLRPRADERDAFGKVAVAVHGRTYEEGTEEPLALTKQRVADALEAVAAAVEQDKKDLFGAVIVPLKEALRVGLPVDGPAVSYGPTVGRIKEQTTRARITMRRWR